MNAQVGMLEQSLRQRLEITRLNAEVTQETMNKEALARSLDEEQTARREVQDTLNEAAQMIIKLQEDCENLRVELAATKNLERQRKDKRDVAKKQRRDKHIQSLEEKTGTLGDAAHASEDHKDEEPQDKDARHLALHVSQAARDTCVRQQFKALEAYTQFYTSQVLATQQATFEEFGHGNTADVPAIVQEKTLEISKSRIKET
jgi:DNA polymerase II large subunit